MISSFSSPHRSHSLILFLLVQSSLTCRRDHKQRAAKSPQSADTQTHSERSNTTYRGLLVAAMPQISLLYLSNATSAHLTIVGLLVVFDRQQ